MFRSPFPASLVRTLAAAALVAGVVSEARAEALQRPTTLPESQQRLLVDASARAFDHVRAARRQIAEGQSYAARQELARASALLAQARAASPATRVREAIETLWIRLQDPTVRVGAAEFEPIFTRIAAAGDPQAWSATRRYVERARYFRQDGATAANELVQASARIPEGALDGPLTAARARVHAAMIELYGGELAAADAVAALAERATGFAVRIAGGEVSLPDVASPPAPDLEWTDPAGEAAAPAAERKIEATESRLPEPHEFDESNGAEPEAAPSEGATDAAPEAAEPEAPETAPEAEPAPGV